MERYGSFSRVTKVVFKIYNDINSLQAKREIKFYKSTNNKTGNYICKLIKELDDGIILEDCGIPILEHLKKEQKTQKHLLEQLASAIATIHKLGYYHGDLNYTNILVDHKSNIKVCDFTSTDLTNIKTEPQTFAEGFEDPDKGHPIMSDIYSMGIIFWCIFSKKLPPMNYKLIAKDFDSESNPIVTRSETLYHSEILPMNFIDIEPYMNLIKNMTGKIKHRPQSSLEVYNFCINTNISNQT